MPLAGHVRYQLDGVFLGVDVLAIACDWPLDIRTSRTSGVPVDTYPVHDHLRWEWRVRTGLTGIITADGQVQD